MGSLGLGAEVGIAVGSLVIVAIGVWLIKQNLAKRKAKKSRSANEEVMMKMKMNSREKLVGRKLEGGDKPYFGGMRSHSPAPSYVLSPSTTIVNWGDSKNSIHSASSSVIDLPRSRDGSVVSFPAVPQPAKMKPSPLRPNPGDIPFTGRVSATNSVGGSYMPPLPLPRGFANPQASSTWVAPLDVHYSRPSTPQAIPSRPESYLPRLQFPQDVGKNALLVPTPAGSGAAISSEAASIISSTATATVVVDPQLAKSPTFNFNFFDTEPAKVPSREAEQSTRSIFPATTSDDHPTSRRSAKSFGLGQTTVPLPAVPQTYFGPKSPGLDPNQYGNHAVIRNSVVSKRSVSIYQPDTLPTSPQAHTRAHSRVASSVYSLNDRSRSLSPKTWSRSRSTSSKRVSSSHSLARAQDSIRRHSRKMSLNEKRRSRERDQIHYDPTSHHRNRSGSVQGRSVNFDRPRESPFSNAHAIPTHSTASSISTISSTGIPFQTPTQPVPKFPMRELGLGLNLPEPDRLSVMTATSRRGRSASDASQSSLGFNSFYDSYYRQSVLNQRASAASQVRGSGELMVVGVALTSNGNGNDVMGMRCRPPPLRLGGTGLAGVVEVAGPVPSSMVGEERFPSRI